MSVFGNIVDTVTHTFGLKSYFYYQAEAKSRWDNAEKIELCLAELKNNPDQATNNFYNQYDSYPSYLESLNSEFKWHYEYLNETYFPNGAWYYNRYHLPIGRPQYKAIELAKVLSNNARTLRFENRKDRILSYIMPVITICLFPAGLFIATLKDIPWFIPRLGNWIVDHIDAICENSYVSGLRKKERSDKLEADHAMFCEIIDLPVIFTQYITIMLPLNLVIAIARAVTDFIDPYKAFAVSTNPPSNMDNEDANAPTTINTENSVTQQNQMTPLITPVRNANRNDSIGALSNDAANNHELLESKIRTVSGNDFRS